MLVGQDVALRKSRLGGVEVDNAVLALEEILLWYEQQALPRESLQDARSLLVPSFSHFVSLNRLFSHFLIINL